MKATFFAVSFWLAACIAQKQQPPPSELFPLSASCSGWCPGERMCTEELDPNGGPNKCQIQNQSCSTSKMCRRRAKKLSIEARAVGSEYLEGPQNPEDWLYGVESQEEDAGTDQSPYSSPSPPSDTPTGQGTQSGGIPGWPKFAGHGPVIIPGGVLSNLPKQPTPPKPVSSMVS